MSSLLRTLAQNVNGLLVLIGFVVICASIAQWSGIVAGIVAGVMMAGIGLSPYLKRG